MLSLRRKKACHRSWWSGLAFIRPPFEMQRKNIMLET